MSSIAFFDLDHTLVSRSSMHSFASAYLASLGRAADYSSLERQLSSMASIGAPRAARNRVFFRALAGCEESLVAEFGRRWFVAERTEPDFLVTPVLDELRRHQRRGDRTVLVSGSFAACVEPIADALGIDATITAVQQTANGVLTGEIDEPMIGDAKARAARRHAASCRVRLEDCRAYGDHVSDLPILRAVGHPVVVGEDHDLVNHVEAFGWHRLHPSGAVASPHASTPGSQPPA